MTKTKIDNQDKSISHHLGLTARTLRNHTGRLLKDLKLFPGQEQVLEALLRHGTASSMGSLAEELHVKAPTISKTVLRLSAQGLVTRNDSSADKRQVFVMLTEAGRECAVKLNSISEELENIVVQGFDAKDRRRFRKYLRKAARNLTGFRPAQSEDDHDD